MRTLHTAVKSRILQLKAKIHHEKTDICEARSSFHISPAKQQHSYNSLHRGAWWLTGTVLESRLVGLRVRASPEALHCVLEQDTPYSAYNGFNPGKSVPT